MATTATFEWMIESLDYKPQVDNYANVVTTVYWRLRGTQDTITVDSYGSCGLPGPSEDFIAYESLTKDEVLSWIWNSQVDKANNEASISKQIEAIANPPVKRSDKLPWE